MLTRKQIMNAYEDIEIAVMQIENKPLQRNLNQLSAALDTFFEGTHSNIIYTTNIDKMFFGLYAMPNIPADDIIKAITGNKNIMVKNYFLELDSKLFAPNLYDMRLTSKEIAALIVHDVGKLTLDSSPFSEVMKALDEYLIINHQTLQLTDIIHYREMLGFGIRDAMRKITSIFESGKYDREHDVVDSFVDWFDYGSLIDNALQKVANAGYLFNKEISNKFITLSWVMRVYRDVLGYRISAIKTLERMQELTPSQIEKKELSNFLRRINRIDDDMLLGESADSVGEAILNECRRARFPIDKDVIDCMERGDKDVMDLAFRSEHVKENDPDGIPDLLRSINNSMMYMKDYVENHEYDKGTVAQWNKMYGNLAKMRNQIAKEKAYSPDYKLIRTFKAQDDQ